MFTHHDFTHSIAAIKKYSVCDIRASPPFALLVCFVKFKRIHGVCFGDTAAAAGGRPDGDESVVVIV